jgi:glyoxylase-like metal-dependent hydrolase (beta-lactamase superfamily II)
MKRLIVLALLIAAGGLAAAARTLPQGAQAAPKAVEVEKLKENLFVLKGGGGNTAVFVQSNGVTVVDTKLPGWGEPILAKIKELTDKPVTTIVNTHTHGDHVSGNVEFPATVDVVTHANTKANMEKMAAPSGFPPNSANIFQQNNGRGLPKRTFTDTLSIGSGADRIDLRYFGRGHTNGDAWVVFPALRVVHAGDIFSGKNIPLLDGNNGGSGLAIAGTLQKAHDALTEIDQIITGHSTVMTRADLKQYAEFNREFVDMVREAKKAGHPVEHVIAGYEIPERYAGYATPQEARLKANVELLYREIQ